MAGVTSFNGGSASYRPTTTTVYPGTTLVAEWSDGHPLVAVADVNGAHRADVCFFPPSSDTGSNRWDTTTDGARMLANALSWTISGQGWLQVQGTRSGTVGGGACEAKTVTFDAAGLEPGTYTADLVIAHNDPMNPSVTVPCTLTVRVDDLRAQPETGLDAEGYFGGPFTPGQAVYTLTNAGTVDLPWQAAADVPWVDAVPASGTLAAGATVNRGCVVQTHLFHDRIMQMDAVTLEAGATLGPNCVALPAARLGAGATVGPASLVMRGDEVPPATRWQGNPIVPWLVSGKKRGAASREPAQ